MGSHSPHVTRFVFYLKSHSELLSTLTEKCKGPWLDLLVETYAFSFFEDLSQPQFSHFKFLRVMLTLIKGNSKLGDLLNETSYTFFGKLLTLYAELRPQRKYLIQTFRKPLLQIVYGDQRDLFIDLRLLYRKVTISRNALASSPDQRGTKRKEVPLDVDAIICLNDSEVMVGVVQLSELLISRCRMLLDEVYSQVEALPYGVRWICKVLSQEVAETAHDFAAEQSRFIGSFLFGKWWLPAFITAGGNGLLQDCDVPRVIRQNLSLMSNVRTKQVIKHVFKDSALKGPQFDHINQFIREEVPRMRAYFATVIDVPDYVSVGIETGEQSLQTALVSISEIKGLIELVIGSEASLIGQGHEELVQLAAAIKTAQQLDDLFETQEYTKEQYLLMFSPELKDKSSPLKRHADKLVGTVKEVTLDLLMDLGHLGDFCNQGPDSSLLDIVQFIIDYPYLFELTRDKGIPVQTLAEYLRVNLRLLPPVYQTDSFVRLYSELKEEQMELFRTKTPSAQQEKQRLLYSLEILGIYLKEADAECAVLEHYDRTQELIDFVKTACIPVCVFHNKTKARVRVDRQKECEHLRIEYFESLQPNHSMLRSPRTSARPDNKAKIGHISTIDEFAEEFSHLDPVVQSTEALDDPEKISQAFFKYIAILREEVAKRFPKKSPEDQDKLAEELESYILRKMFSEVFPSWASHSDTVLHHKTLELDWLQPEHLDIPPGDLSMWRSAIDSLSRIDLYMSPVEKLNCLVEFLTKTVDLLFLYSFKEVVSADDSLPVVIYLLVKSHPPRMHSNINFISKFRHQRKLLADSGFCFSQIQSAIAFIEQADGSSLTISPEEFDSRRADARRRHNLT
jgi:hypothetical protein